MPSSDIGPCGMADPDRPPIAPRRRPRLSTSVALRPYPPLVVPGPHPRPRTRPPTARPRASRRNAPGSEVAASRATRRARAPDLGASSSTRVTRYRAAPGLDATTTARVPARTGARRAGRWRRFRLYRSIYTLSRSRRSNMQPARDHLNSITVVCASPRRAAPLRLHRPHVARVYRTTGDHRTHYLIKSRSEPKRPPRG